MSIFGADDAHWDTELAPPSSALVFDDPEFAGSYNGDGFLSGDPYRESDDVTRGISLAHDDMHMFSMGMGFKDDWSDGFYGKDASYQMPEALAPESNSEQQEFQPGDVPPLPPASKHFRLEPTALSFEGVKPYELGNAMLVFLRTQVVSGISKIRPAKFAVKAEVVIEEVACALKIRLYRSEVASAQYSMEFQRRGGSKFVFDQVYNLAAAFIAARVAAPCNWQEGAYRQTFVEPPELDVSDMENDPDVATLFEMASLPELQSEAAGALSQLAKCGRGSAAPLLKVPEAAGAAFTELLRSDQLEASYSAAYALVELATQGHAKPILAAEGLREAAARHVGTNVGAQGHATSVFEQLSSILELNELSMRSDLRAEVPAY